ncbi:patatin-like phospholipase family protein [Nakamurella multipartita]|jgi:NTE family protein|uniref:Patatin n=1 Tax=Nakamurella multipartita (strain ATCC 700099 / DSM 44233 / CIP 104796 / JCM 9543 / NBRC 105858 / Y-104) TaxID=479431 RepID=C8XA26_NAKMY|nr:patatin-like phospholipase family protein [Nakamurella multipartita]ACV81226.1 Patatin [Nakamurella multipartita DSM 44233]
MANQPPVTIAIACQGGGSHTAFTAGVLSRWLEDDALREVEVKGLSGTSGGAICALLAWSALLEKRPEDARRRLASFWAANSAASPAEKVVNDLILAASRLSHYVAAPAISPYSTPTSTMSLDHLRSLLEDALDFTAIGQLAADAGEQAPLLLLGAVDVLSGSFKAFNSHEGEISADAVLASAAIPNLFRSVPVDGHLYWDGLFSQNPPIGDLLYCEPDEIWVIQINPTERVTEPTSVLEIEDRRNELGGNLSLYQELNFIEQMDSMIERGLLRSERYRPVTVRILEMNRPPSSERLGYASKLNRDPAFLRELIAQGEEQAGEFLAALRFENAWDAGELETVLDFFAPDALIASSSPFSELAPTRDPAARREYLTDRLAAGVTIDHNRKQIVKRNHAKWRIRSTDPSTGVKVEGTAAADFRDGKVVRFSLGTFDMFPLDPLEE